MDSTLSALFVIDIQNGLASSPGEIPHAARIREAATAILHQVRSKPETSRKPIVFIVQHEESPDSGDLVRGSPAWELVFPTMDGSESLLSKHTCNTFESNPDLIDQLRSQGVETLVLFGIQSEYCVRETALGALEAGFRVVLLSGAHSTYDDTRSGKSALDIEQEVETELTGKGAVLVPWEKWLEQPWNR